MAGLGVILETARRALLTDQVAISVTSHNIANSSTAGYTRQRINIVSTGALKQRYGFLGTGVTTAGIERTRDSFIDNQIRYTNSLLGDANARQKILSQIESSFNEPSDAGLSSQMTSFFNSFQDLATHPEDSSARNSVVQQANLLDENFHRLSGETAQLRSSLTEDITSKVGTINQLAEKISDLNMQISNDVVGGGTPSDLMDARDKAIEDLSALVNTNVVDDKNGAVKVSIGGTMLASRDGFVPIRAQPIANGFQIVSVIDGLNVNLNGGELGGDLKLYNTTIPGYLTKLDQLAAGLINGVNTLHQAGYGIGTPPPIGNAFFTGTGAGDISLSAVIADNPNLIAASSDGTPGNNQVALSLANVPQENIMNGNTMTLSGFYNRLASGVGADINSASADQNSQSIVQQQLDNQRSSVSGVSLDEEMTNLIKYQQAFSAAARLVTTSNEMFTSLINIT